MPIFAYIFWALVLAIIGGGIVGCGGLFIVAKKKGWKVTTWLSGLGFIGFVAIAVTGVVAMAHGYYRSTTPELVFEDTFGKKPPNGTIMVHGERGGFADSAYAGLAFRSDRATFYAILPVELRIATPPIQDMPAWWRTPTASTEVWYYSEHFDIQAPRPPLARGFYSVNVIMTWDADGLVQYHWVGID